MEKAFVRRKPCSSFQCSKLSYFCVVFTLHTVIYFVLLIAALNTVEKRYTVFYLLQCTLFEMKIMIKYCLCTILGRYIITSFLCKIKVHTVLVSAIYFIKYSIKISQKHLQKFFPIFTKKSQNKKNVTTKLYFILMYQTRMTKSI